MDLISLIARNVIVMEGTMTSQMNVGSDVSWRSSRGPVPIHRRISSSDFNNENKSSISSNKHNSKLRRRYSMGDFNNQSGAKDKSHCHLQRQSSLTDIRDISWSEYTARRSLVKFRNRHSAAYRSRDQFGGLPPSKMAVRVLCNQYEICRNKHTRMSERVMAVFYCWFFGWVTDVYSFLTYGCAEKSFFKWMVSSALITLGATVLVVLVCLLAHGMLTFLALILRSAVNFLAFLTMIFLLTIGLVTIFSYSKFHYTNGRTISRNRAIYRYNNSK